MCSCLSTLLSNICLKYGWKGVCVNKKDLSKTEFEIMKYIWSVNGEVMPKEIRTHFSHKQWSKQAVSTFLKRLVTSGYLNMRKVSPAKYYYSAIITEEESNLLPVIDIINNTFDGSYISFIESLIDHKKDFDEKELDDLQKFINYKRQEIQQQQAEIHS